MSVVSTHCAHLPILILLPGSQRPLQSSEELTTTLGQVYPREVGQLATVEAYTYPPTLIRNDSFDTTCWSC